MGDTFYKDIVALAVESVKRELLSFCRLSYVCCRVGQVEPFVRFLCHIWLADRMGVWGMVMVYISYYIT